MAATVTVAFAERPEERPAFQIPRPLPSFLRKQESSDSQVAESDVALAALDELHRDYFTLIASAGKPPLPSLRLASASSLALP